MCRKQPRIFQSFCLISLIICRTSYALANKTLRIMTMTLWLWLLLETWTWKLLPNNCKDMMAGKFFNGQWSQRDVVENRLTKSYFILSIEPDWGAIETISEYTDFSMWLWGQEMKFNELWLCANAASWRVTAMSTVSSLDQVDEDY